GLQVRAKEPPERGEGGLGGREVLDERHRHELLKSGISAPHGQLEYPHGCGEDGTEGTVQPYFLVQEADEVAEQHMRQGFVVLGQVLLVELVEPGGARAECSEDVLVGELGHCPVNALRRSSSIACA